MNEMVVKAPGPDTVSSLQDDIYLPRGAMLELRGKLYQVHSRIHTPEPGLALMDPLVPDVTMTITSAEVKDLYLKGKLTFRASGFEKLPPEIQENLRVAMDAFGEGIRVEMLRRAGYCELVDRLSPYDSRTAAHMQPILDEYADEHGDAGAHSWSSVNRWHKRWVLAGGDPRCLVPNHHLKGNRLPKVPAAMDKALNEAVDKWLDLGRPSMSWTYGHVIGKGVETVGGRAAALEVERLAPSLEAFRARCHAVDRATTLAHRYGAKVARQVMHPVGAGPEPKFPLERVEMDFMYMPLFIVDDGPTPMPLGTPYITAGIDCYSGVICGFDVGFDPPSYVSLARCLKHMIQPKILSGLPKDEYGVPVVRNTYPVNGPPYHVFLDNDQVFHSFAFEQTAKAIGVNLNFVPPGEPWKKGHIERFWLTVQQTFFGGIPGKVFKPYQAPPDYNPAENAVLTLSEFKLLLYKAIVDVYHAGFDELRGERRIDLFLRGMDLKEARPLPAYESLIELVGSYATRVIDNRGIRIHGLRYNGPQVSQYRSMFEQDPTVEIRYDAQDISKVYIIDRERRRSIEVECRERDYAAGLSEYQHKIIRSRAAKNSPAGRIHQRELQIAKAELYKLAESMLRTKKTRRGRMRVAQFLGVGRELLDEIARRPFDPEASASHLDFDDLIDDAEARAETDPARPAKPRRSPPSSQDSQPAPTSSDPIQTPASDMAATQPRGAAPEQPIRRKPKVTRD